MTFNYDRSLERALFDAYRYSFNVLPEQAVQAGRETVPIVRVHGSLGDLVERAGDSGRLYRPLPEDWAVQQAAREIIILPRAQHSSPQFEEARKLIANAERVILLGCHYHESNMKRLSLRPGQKQFRIGTGYGLSEFERLGAGHRLASRLVGEIGDASSSSARPSTYRIECRPLPAPRALAREARRENVRNGLKDSHKVPPQLSDPAGRK